MGDIKIDNLQPANLPRAESDKQTAQGNFGSMIKEAINTVNKAEKDADRSVVDLLEGKVEIHETMVALQKADISMRLLLTVRNKVLEAYREIMHMQF